MAISWVAICRKSIDQKTIQIIFGLTLTFNHVVNKLSPNLKNILHIKKKTLSKLLILAYIKPYNYNIDIHKKNTKILFSFLFFSRVYLFAFVYSIYNTSDISRKFFMTLSVHHACLKDGRDKIQKKHFSTLSEQPIYYLFLYKAYCFFYYHNLLIITTNQVVIR